jgi:prepilin-type N-terminal cleavage/methylation domain-containing protein
MGEDRTATMTTRLELGAERPGVRLGFTLTELLVVITIIGIILAFLLTAAMDATRRAEERATQSLITKLEGGLNDRLDALMQNQPTPNYAHGYLAGVYPGTGTEADGGPLMLPSALLPPPFGQPPSGLPNPKCNTLQRAQVIATFDYIKAEMPDVFFVDPLFRQNPGSVSYPINFTGLPFPGTPLVTFGAYMLPLGHMIQGPRNALPAATAWTEGYGDSHPDPTTHYLVSTHPELGYTGSGINGASYTAAAALYKNLGYAPIGYDMIDNDGNGLVDDWLEGISGSSAQQVSSLVSNISAHKHNTARAEMLYAILVEGAGPLGSVFNRDDFTDKEVRDTDGDGLPEFVDAWGQPLQFFRWPLLYHSDIQRGQAFVATAPQTWSLVPPYPGTLAQREQDPLDVNQQLVATAWWSKVGNGGLSANPNSPFSLNPSVSFPAAANVSPAAVVFSTMFHTLFEPLPLVTGLDWDRSGISNRRAFFTKFLVLSGGQDQMPGVFLYPDAYLYPTSGTPLSADSISTLLIANENNAMPFGWSSGAPDVDFTQASPKGAPIGLSTINYNVQSIPSYPTTYETFQAAQDDITNQNLEATGGIGGSR